MIAFPPQQIPMPESVSVCCSPYDGENLIVDNNSEKSMLFRCLRDNSMTSPLPALKNKISEIDNLSDNWDGYNAIAPLKDVVKNTFKFVDCLFGDGYISVDENDIIPTPYGSIVLDVRTVMGLVSIEIGTSQLGYFTEYEKGDDMSSDGIETDFKSIPRELKEALDRLL